MKTPEVAAASPRLVEALIRSEISEALTLARLPAFSPTLGLLGGGVRNEVRNGVPLPPLSLDAARQLIAQAKQTGALGLVLRGCRELTDLNELTGLEALRALDLRGCAQLKDLRPLVRLPALQSLDLSDCPEIRDLEPLAFLKSLRTLKLAGSDAVENLAVLKQLPHLEMLDLSEAEQLTDFSSLARLTGLKQLELAGAKLLHDLRPLAPLLALQRLNLERCALVHDLSPLMMLPGLRELVLLSTAVETLPRWLMEHAALRHLWVDRLKDAPWELQSKDREDDSLSRLHAWWNDRQGGSGQEVEMKVCVLGNRSVGKTQFCRFLQGEPYDDRVRRGDSVSLTRLALGGEPATVKARMNVWEISERDLCHRLHAPFRRRDTVFVILWTPELEAAAHAEPADGRHPLGWWIDYARSMAGTEGAILIVQSQCDKIDDERDPVGAPPGVLVRHFSARTGHGQTPLLDSLRYEATRLRFSSAPPPLGPGWEAVRSELRQRLAAGLRTMKRGEFEALCRETGGVSNPTALLQYLHRAGVVLHLNDRSGGRIIVDQNWALGAMSVALEQVRAMGEGRFTRRSVWESGSSLTKDDQELVTALMEECAVCFRSGENEHGETTWLAPEFLPSHRSAELGEHPARLRERASARELRD